MNIFQAFHDNGPKEPKVEEAEEEDDDLPTFSEDMNEARQQIQKINGASSEDVDVAATEAPPEATPEVVESTNPYGEWQAENAQGAAEEAAYDPNAYPGEKRDSGASY